MKKRLLIIVLAMCMALALLPSTVFATNDIIASGECGAQGNNLTWTLGSDGTLTISGTGEMADNINDNYSPWRSNREKIKVVAIEDGITSIGILAFSECSSLAEITIPDSVASIGGSAFWRCSSLTTITIPDGVTSIRSGTFDGCSSLTTITIPDSVTSIEGSAFWGCSKLASVSVGENNRRYKSVDNVVFDKACEKIILYPAGKFETSYTIPDSVTSIGDSAFYGCSSLTTITIPDGVTSIGYCAFSGCSGLTDITIPDSVTYIGSSAFWGCSSLTDITIPDSVTSIDGDAFSGCLR